MSTPGRPALGALVAARPFHVGVGSLAAGLCASPGSPLLALGAAAGVALLLGACRACTLGALAAVLVLAGAAAGDARLAALDAPAARVRDGPVERLRVFLATPPRASAFGSSAEAVVAGGALSGTRLLVRVPRWTRLPPDAEVGSELVVDGRLGRLRSGGDAAFDLTAHLRTRGVDAELLLDRAAATGGRREGVAGALDRMRRRAERAVAAGLPPPEAALARGMVLGQDEQIDDSTRQDWRDSGLAHLLAVSGQNVMLLVALALPLLALARLGPYARGVALLALVVLYVPLAGAGPSLQRAGIMGVAGIAAVMLSRPASRWYALLLAAALTLALNPRASADPGWQLSFVAVAGILALGRPLAAALARSGGELLREPAGPVSRALVRGLADGIAITVAATLATAPLVAFHFGSVPLAGLVANLLALPAVAPAMWLGMLKAGLGLLAAPLPPAGALAALLGPAGPAAARVPRAAGGALRRPARRPARAAAAVAGGRRASPTPCWVWRSSWRCGSHDRVDGARPPSVRVPGWRVGALRGGLRPISPSAARVRPASPSGPPLGGALRARSGSRWSRSWSPASCSRPRPGSARPRLRGTSRSAFSTSGRATPRSSSTRTAPPCSSTAARRRAGSRGCCVARASGGSPSWWPRTPHATITAASPRCSAAYPVGLLLDGGDGNPDPALRAVRDEADRRGVRIVPALAPMTLRAGGLAIHVLSPPPRSPGPPPEDPNPRAVVAIVSSGAFDLLLSADAESEALLPLGLPDVEAMKVPHHGSSDPGLPAVLDRVRPQVAAIEVGPNTYGHPTPSTLSALDHAGVTTYRTDRDGTVTLTVKHGRMRVTTEH